MLKVPLFGYKNKKFIRIGDKRSHFNVHIFVIGLKNHAEIGNFSVV